MELTDSDSLMAEYPVEKRSIAIRERIVLPLVIAQHYALQCLNNDVEDDKLTEVYDKLVIRTVYGIVNAGQESCLAQLFFTHYWLIIQKLICFAVNNKPRGLLFVSN